MTVLFHLREREIIEAECGWWTLHCILMCKRKKLQMDGWERKSKRDAKQRQKTSMHDIATRHENGKIKGNADSQPADSEYTFKAWEGGRNWSPELSCKNGTKKNKMASCLESAVNELGDILFGTWGPDSGSLSHVQKWWGCGGLRVNDESHLT